MTTKQIAITGIVLAVIVLVTVGVVRYTSNSRNDVAGAVGNLLAEDYNPYTRQNGGYFSALDIKTSADLNTSGTLTVTGTQTVGSSGSAVSTFNFGSCNLQPDATTIAASTTARVTCHGGNWSAGQAAFTALTGITSSSKIQATLSTTTGAAGKAIGTGQQGLVLLGATASSTSGFIEVLIANQTGTTYTWPTTGSASGTMQYIGTK